jgi:hypothetical protein
MEPVVTEFIIYPHADERCTADAQRKAEDVDEGKTFLTEEIPESDFNVITNHSRFTCLPKTLEPKQMLHAPQA